MGKKIAMREAYGEALAKLGGQDNRVIVLEADVGSSSRSVIFGKKFPDRYFNVGISELNMNAMAAGFAGCGLIPFTNTFAVFMALRGGDPINSVIAYDKLNVKLAGTYCGLSDSYDGASHNSICDLSLMRSLPNMVILSPCDAVETEKAVFAAAFHEGPVYLRISRAELPVITGDGTPFQIGKGIILRDGSDVTVIATGYMVQKALEAADLLKMEGISARIVNIHTIKPVDRDLILRCAAETEAIVTAEEHSVYGGLGSAVSEVLSQEFPVAMEMVGIREFAESGDYEQILSKFGLDADAIAEKARKAISRKKEARGYISNRSE